MAGAGEKAGLEPFSRDFDSLMARDFWRQGFEVQRLRRSIFVRWRPHVSSRILLSFGDILATAARDEAATRRPSDLNTKDRVAILDESRNWVLGAADNCGRDAPKIRFARGRA